MPSVIRFAIVGCGSVSDNRYFPNLSRLPNARLAAVCDVVEARAKAERPGPRRALLHRRRRAGPACPLRSSICWLNLTYDPPTTR